MDVKFQVERDHLADAVSWTARSLPSRPPVPVLAGLLMEAQSSGLTMSSFDYEVSARVDVPADVSEPGRVLVSGRLLADISRSLPDRPVQVATEGTRVTVTCGAARFTLPTLPVEDYPALPDMPETSGSVVTDVFATAVSQVALAAGRDDTLPVLTGVRVEIEGDGITLAATDRYRLAVRTLSWKPELPELSAVALVPARTLADTAKALPAGDDVKVALASGTHGEGLMGVESAGRRTTTRLLEGEFPKYRSLLPSESSSVARVDTASFAEAVRRVALVADRNMPVRLAFGDGQCVLEAGSGDEAQASEAVDAELEGGDITIAFNPAYLLDGLGAVGTDHAQMAFTTPTRPAVISAGPSEEDGSDYRYLLMPVRLSG